MPSNGQNGLIQLCKPEEVTGSIPVRSTELGANCAPLGWEDAGIGESTAAADSADQRARHSSGAQ
jgi:hypothetical protein